MTLHDGRGVDSWSTEWRAECEARHVLRLPQKRLRHDYLERVQSKRGEPARKELERLVLAVWQAGKKSKDDGATEGIALRA